MNARYVGLTPYADWYSFFSFARIALTFDMSTSIALVTWADVSSERRMCSAIPLRIAVMGSKVSPTAACGCGRVAVRGEPGPVGGGAGAARSAGGAAVVDG